MKVDKYKYKPASGKYYKTKGVRVNNIEKLYEDYIRINGISNITKECLRCRLYKSWSIYKILHTPYLGRGGARNFKSNKKSGK